jgi:DNA-binding GntR family transcriptional regulator
MAAAMGMGDAATLASLAAEAYAVLRHRILCGEIPLGRSISRRQVAAELGMSFLPVTNAMLRLEYDGLVESRPRAGTRVRVPTREEVEGQHLVRVALETHAAVLFNATASDDERDDLRDRAARLDTGGEAGEASSYANRHAGLHAAIAAGTHCAALQDAVSQVNGLALTWSTALSAAPVPGASGEHVALAEAITRGTPDEAQQAMRAHLDHELEGLRMPLDPWAAVDRAADARFHRAPRRMRRLPAASGF